MTSRSRSRRLIATAAAGLAVFLTILVLLGAQMARGHDPALGASVTTTKATVTTAAATSTDDSTAAISGDTSTGAGAAGTSAQSSSPTQALQTSSS